MVSSGMFTITAVHYVHNFTANFNKRSLITTCLGKSCLFVLLCVSFVDVCHSFSECASFPFGLRVECGI